MIIAHPFKPYLKLPIDNGIHPVIQQGFDSILGHANGEPIKDFKSTILFGDHTLSLYRPKVPYFVATDGLKIISSTKKMGQDFLYFLLEKNIPTSEGYKRYFNILKEKNVKYPKSKEEQDKIGSLFDSIDQLITLHQRKYDVLVKIEKHPLQTIFSNCGEMYPIFFQRIY